MGEIPDIVWTLPAPTLILILLATGMLVTRREHSNMTKMMEYFRQQVDDKNIVIKKLSETVETLGEAAQVTTKVVETVREIAGDGKKGNP